MTLDDDVAVRIEHLRQKRDASFDDVVNDALRRGLQEIAVKSKPKRPFRTKAFKGGKLLVQNVDNTAELLAQIEGEAYM